MSAKIWHIWTPCQCHFTQLIRLLLAKPNSGCHICILPYVYRGIQGCSARWAPGCVKLGEKVAFCLPSAGRRTQLFQLIFSQPGVHLLEHPCTCHKTLIFNNDQVFGHTSELGNFTIFVCLLALGNGSSTKGDVSRDHSIDYNLFNQKLMDRSSLLNCL